MIKCFIFIYINHTKSLKLFYNSDTMYFINNKEVNPFFHILSSITFGVLSCISNTYKKVDCDFIGLNLETIKSYENRNLKMIISVHKEHIHPILFVVDLQELQCQIHVNPDGTAFRIFNDGYGSDVFLNLKDALEASISLKELKALEALREIEAYKEANCHPDNDDTIEDIAESAIIEKSINLVHLPSLGFVEIWINIDPISMKLKRNVHLYE